ncbi:MAG: LysM peptidoglycan-binding domain-containing protein [Candidatus Thiodiazotropha sp.]|jgi:LysM repeat protein
MSDTTYIVKKGDNLSGIAKKHRVSVGDIIRLNPSLRKNPDRIVPGMAVKVSKEKVESDPRIAKITFDGKNVRVYSINNGKVIAKYPAISGLPPNAPHLKELIKKGRKDLKVDTDYTKPEHQNVHDAGPIQQDYYTLPLKKNMPFDKSSEADDPPGWGVGGWYLKENFTAKVGNWFGGRHGFFLHHDGGSRGTSGCIGLKHGKDIKELRKYLKKAQEKGQDSVLVEVEYK